MKTSFIILSILLSFSCQNDPKSVASKQQDTLYKDSNLTAEVLTVQDSIPAFKEFDRTSIKERLQQKINNKEALFVHVFIPLCDNDHQGIVPVSRSLGDGFNPNSNLYWGALYGFKTHFKKLRDWGLIHVEEQAGEHVLERVIFKRTYSNGATVFLIGDAYQGDKMKECLADYFSALSGVLQDSILLDSEPSILTSGQADLLIFNGHNGLMDVSIEPIPNQDQVKKDAIAIACVSSSYFDEYLKSSKAYPLLMTTNLLAPEAYVLANAIDSWVNMEAEEDILLSAAQAYNTYQKCGLRGAKRLFKTGWE